VVFTTKPEFTPANFSVSPKQPSSPLFYISFRIYIYYCVPKANTVPANKLYYTVNLIQNPGPYLNIFYLITKQALPVFYVPKKTFKDFMSSPSLVVVFLLVCFSKIMMILNNLHHIEPPNPNPLKVNKKYLLNKII
jgi:hypothetical protein